MAAIRIEGLEKAFGPVQALDELTLSIEPGSVFGFLGPNGAGKTTAIRILTGLARANDGRAWVAGVQVAGDGARRGRVAERIGYLPQEPAFYPWMTARELLDHVGRIFGLGSDERQARVGELLQLVNLCDAADRRIGGFSGGMRQRLGIAQALVNQPQVLFLDEPVSALDPVGRKEVLGLIERLRGERTVFMSTHILADVERVCDTVGIINRGKLVAEAPQDELLERYVVPAFEVEVENGFAEQLQAWTAGLDQVSWVDSVTLDRRTARVMVNDLDVAKRDLMGLTAQAGLVLTRYEVVRPSLEDVFVRLVSEGEG